MEPDVITPWLLEYGCLAIFILLALGIVLLPVPDDTLIIFTGILIHQGKLPPLMAIISAYGGSICGITMSYLIGRFAGEHVIKKYGPYIGLTEIRMARLHWWFERFGRAILFIGFFIAGLRHFTGLFAGLSYMQYKHFCFYAYLGAIAWVSSLLGLGYFFGSCCTDMLKYIEANIGIAVVFLVFCWLAYLGIKYVFFSKRRT